MQATPLHVPQRLARRLWHSLLGSLGLLLLAAPLQAEQGVSAQVIKLGMVNAQSGNAAEIGLGMRQGAEAYLRRINAAGGIHGRQLLLLSRDDGYEPMAITSHLGRIGSSDAVELVASMDELAAGFAFEKLGRAPARYDTADLDRLNAQAIHSLDYAAAQPRLAALGVDLGEGFWLAVRANLNRFGDARDWAEVLTGAVSGPRLDEAFKAAAIVAFEAAVPPGATPDLETWGQFTSAVKEATGAKGGALFKPLRQALTGRDAGPDMAALLPLIGRDRVLERLRGG